MKQRTVTWSLLLTALFASVIGGCLRAVQLRQELNADGSLAQGSFLHYVLAGLTAVFLLAAALLTHALTKQRGTDDYFVNAAPDSYRGRAELLPHAFQLLAAALLLLGSFLLWRQGVQPLNSYATKSPRAARVMAALLPPLGIVAACCIGAFALRCLQARRSTPLLYMTASLYLILRLIVCFQEWNADPSIHDYCFKLLAAICDMLAAFQLAGFGFDRGKRRITLFWTLGAVFFGALTIPDALNDPPELCIAAALLLSMLTSSVQLLFGEVRRTEEVKE